MSGRLLDETAAADYLGLTAGQIRGLREKRQIPVTKVGRRVYFDVNQLDRWIASHTIPVAS